MKVPEVLSDPKGWKRVSALFDELFDLPVEARQPWLENLKANDPTLARHLENLLAAHERVEAENFLDVSLGASNRPAIASTHTLTGKVFGAYSLVEPLGQGGMGWVWLAERNDGRFEGRVAIKLLHAGLVRDADLERFRREGSVLARLSHPNIARLLDAGVADGQPYLVLEYVKGRRIDEACDQSALDLPSRVRLCLEALDAVGHAHARLVLHRDIKPSNVLVDDDGHVKLIDFGVARLVESEDASATGIDVTREFGQAFTPRFGAPEQWANGPVSTATDVYAMGLMMYVLLAGANPRDKLPAGANSSTDLPLASVVARGRGDLKRAKALRGDLDNILAKAVKPEPAERYLTAGSLADDLRRFLRGDPVTARPDSVGYRMKRFVGRHKMGVGGATAALVAIGMLSAAALWQADEAYDQRRRAVARGAAAYALAQAPTRIDRALLLGVEAVRMHQAPETTVGLYAGVDAARHLVGFRRELRGDVGVGVSDDGTRAVTIDPSGLLKLWAMPGWKLVKERQTGLRDDAWVTFVRGGERLLVNSVTSALFLETATLEPVNARLSLVPPDFDAAKGFGIANFDVSADGSLMALSSYQQSERVHVFDVATATLKHTVGIGKCHQLLMTALLPGGKEIALGCMSGLYVHDLESGALLRTRPGTVGVLAVDPTGRFLLLVPWGADVAVVDIKTLEPVMPILPIPGGRLSGLAFTQNGNYLAIGTDTGWMAVWDIPGKRELARFGGLERSARSLWWLEQDFTIGSDNTVSGRARLLAGTREGWTEWDVAQASTVGVASKPSLPMAALVSAHDTTNDLIYTGRTEPSGKAVIEATTTTDSSVRRRFEVDAQTARPAVISDDGQLLLVSTATERSGGAPPDVQLRIVATSDGRTVRTLDVPEWYFDLQDARNRENTLIAPSVSAAKFSPDGKKLASWRALRTGQQVTARRSGLVVWSVTTGKVVTTTVDARAPSPLVAWAWTPDGRALVGADTGVYRVYDAETAAVTHTIKYGGTLSVKHAITSAALGGVVFSSEGGEVVVIDGARGVISGEPFRAGGSQLQTSAISPDGRYLAATSSDGSVRVWDVATRVPVSPPLRGHAPGRAYPHVWFTGNSTLSTYMSGTRIDWTLDAAATADAACARVGRALTDLEWRQFVGDVPYAPACRPR